MADSYNELFGLGSHSEDANLEGWWPLQDDAASTTVNDQSSNANDGTLEGGDNTSDLSTTGPNSWLSSAMQFDGLADYVNLGVVFEPGSSPFTILSRVSHAATAASRTIVRRDNLGGTGTRTITFLRFDSGSGRLRWYNADQVANTEDVFPAGTTYDDGTWRAVAGVVRATTTDLILDGSSVGTAGDLGNLTQSGDASWTIGAYRYPSGTTGEYSSGAHCDTSLWSRDLSLAEVQNWVDGPEVNYSSGASWDDAGNFDVGEWALPAPFASGSNGTVTYEVVAANAAGSVIDSATGSTGTLDISAEAGNTVYLLVRASNTGGYDIGDKSTRTSSYGSAGDGYYEIASVTAAGGGGSSVSPSPATIAWTIIPATTKITHTPSPAAVDWTPQTPTTELSASLTPAVVNWDTIAPTTTLSISLAPATVDWLPITPATSGDLLVTPSPALIDWTPQAVTTQLSIAPSPASVDWLPITPITRLSVAPTPAAVEWLPVSPTTAISVTPSPAIIDWLPVTPTATLTLTIAPATVDWLPITPTATAGTIVTPTPVTVDWLPIAMQTSLFVTATPATIEWTPVAAIASADFTGFIYVTNEQMLKPSVTNEQMLKPSVTDETMTHGN